jgi:hypothetical protein
VTSEISNENFDHFEEEEPFYPEESKSRKAGARKIDMNFIGYTYKADVEEQRNQLVNVLKDLGKQQDGHVIEDDDYSIHQKPHPQQQKSL